MSTDWWWSKRSALWGLDWRSRVQILTPSADFPNRQLSVGHDLLPESDAYCHFIDKESKKIRDRRVHNWNSSGWTFLAKRETIGQLVERCKLGRNPRKLSLYGNFYQRARITSLSSFVNGKMTTNLKMVQINGRPTKNYLSLDLISSKLMTTNLQRLWRPDWQCKLNRLVWFIRAEETRDRYISDFIVFRFVTWHS